MQRDSITGVTYYRPDLGEQWLHDDRFVIEESEVHPDPEWRFLIDPYDHEPTPPLTCGRIPKPRPLPEDAADREENRNHALRQFMRRTDQPESITAPGVFAGKWPPLKLDQG